ncbi:MAG: c-type cytochrome, partial [Alphaproteobacteria bacterium]|nr:c-type cytochrome [Alphaproteobacteria bacterium]
MAHTTRTSALIALICFLLVPVACAERSASQERGRAIYFGDNGSALDGAEVQIGALTTKLPARTFPCASCHGRTGSGQSERGVNPSQITRDALTRPYSVKESAGRKRPPYTAATFRNAVRNGKDSGGNALAEAMPRFNFTDKQLADIWAFLEVIDDVTDPGVSDDAIRVGVVVDAANPVTQPQQKLLNVLAADINKIGGVNGRALTFVPLTPKGAAGDTVFALIVPQGAAPAGLAADVPVISVLPPPVAAAGAFALVTSEADQVAALKRFAAETWGVVRVKDACAARKGDTVLLAAASCAGSAKVASRVLMTQSVFASTPPASRSQLPPDSYVSIAAPLSRIAP